MLSLHKWEVETLWQENRAVVLIISTHEDGTPPDSAKWFVSWLGDSTSDFRVGQGALSNLRVAVYGCGNSLYGSKFNAVSGFE